MSKGSRRRPEDSAKISANWDLIFGKKWDHSCTVNMSVMRMGQNEKCPWCEETYNCWYHMCKHNGPVYTGRNEACSWCGVFEDKKFD